MFYNRYVRNLLVENSDLYDSLVRRGIFNIYKIDGNDKEYEISLSYDMATLFIWMLENDFQSLPNIVSIKLFDERLNDDLDFGDFGFIISLIKTLRNKFDKKIKSLTLELSDDMVGVYNFIINSDYQDIKNRLIINMSIDRHPVINDGRSSMNMSLSLGTNTFSVKQLMMFNNEDLEYLLKNEFISNESYSEVMNLKSIVEDFDKYLEEYFYLDRLKDFHKVQLVYKWICGNIKTIYSDKDRNQEYYGSDINDPYVAYISQEGSVLAQSRLMDILLSRSLLKVNSCLLVGRDKNGESFWVGSIIEGNLYYSNLVNGSSMLSLDEECVIETDDINLKIYPTNFLTSREVIGIDYELYDGYYRKKPYTKKK